ncbi:urease accessory protein UreD [Halococcus sp. PRR34]|uniref:urease accessory protein UreD n=1 Tax=Halococcus sp. PRR34 TaxID=3020830 RepID=UPI00235F5F6F|nr:urease accessory protein UreD [Halococcus sp. PRR34]
MAADVPHPAFEGYATETIPQASVGAPGKDGQLELAFATDEAGRTQLARDFARAPFHVGRTLDHDPHPDAATVYIQSPTGGVAQGDRRSVEVSAGEGAIAHVSTASRTKVLSMERNYAAAAVSLDVAAGGYLEYLPEPTILNADARYQQDVTLRVPSGATAILGDVVVPGRLAREERFEFERYVSRLRVRDGDGLLVADTTDFHPTADDRDAPGVLNEFAVYGSLYVLTPSMETDRARESGADHGCVADAEATTTATSADEQPSSATLSDALHECVTGSDVRAGATTLPNDAGVLVRALGHRADSVTDALDAAWDRARTDLLGAPAPDRRKY